MIKIKITHFSTNPTTILAFFLAVGYLFFFYYGMFMFMFMTGRLKKLVSTHDKSKIIALNSIYIEFIYTLFIAPKRSLLFFFTFFLTHMDIRRGP
jgi:hypothetical protein